MQGSKEREREREGSSWQWVERTGNKDDCPGRKVGGVEAGGSLSFLGAEVITRIARCPRETFRWPSLARTQPPPLFVFLPSPPLVYVHACATRIVCVHGPRPCKPREHRRRFLPPLLEIHPFPCTPPPPSYWQRTVSQVAAHRSFPLSRGENKTAGIFQTYCDECSLGRKSFPLFRAVFHSQPVYGVRGWPKNPEIASECFTILLWFVIRIRINF